jgi:hypothetical protein
MKKIIKVEVGTLDYDYNSAESVIFQLNHFIETHGKGNVTISKEYSPYSDGDSYIAIFAHREETDEEYRVRSAADELHRARLLDQERETFEALKKKFGDNPDGYGRKL